MSRRDECPIDILTINGAREVEAALARLVAVLSDARREAARLVDALARGDGDDTSSPPGGGAAQHARDRVPGKSPGGRLRGGFWKRGKERDKERKGGKEGIVR